MEGECKQETKLEASYELDSFENESTIFLYKLRLAQKMESKVEGSTEEMYNFLKESLHQAAKESIGEKKKRRFRMKEYWWKDEIKDLLKEKKQVYERWLNSKDPLDRNIYRKYCYAVKKEVAKLKDAFWEKKCCEIDRLVGGSKSRAAWKTINVFKKDNVEKLTYSPITEEQWKKYYETLLIETRTDFKCIDYSLECVNNSCEDISVHEIRKELMAMKNNKAPGPGGVPVELLKHAPDVTLEYLAEIFNKCLKGEAVPKDWKSAYITSLYKKGNKAVCANYRGLSVIPSTGRLYGRVLRGRIERDMMELEEQSGFRSGRSCTDNLFCLKQLMEKSIAYGCPLHLVFVDLRKSVR